MLRFLRSVRFFFIVAAVLVVGSIVASLIPQGLDRFFSSPLLLLLAGLLELNLLLCTVPRLAGRLRRRTRCLTAYAADVTHLGLAVLIIGGAVSFSLRQEAEFTGGIGETFRYLGFSLDVVEAREVVNDDGVLTSWEIDLRHQGRIETVAINAPITIAGYRVYFRHFERRAVAALRTGDEELLLQAGDGLQAADGTVLVFTGAAEDGDGLFVVDYPDQPTERYRVESGTELFGLVYRLDGRATIVGFRVSRDPGRSVLLAGLIALAVGLGLFALRVLSRKEEAEHG